jgi:tetratricopeptide (TPR) repeat protein
MLCELIGSVGEYVRLNDVVRDYVARSSHQIPDSYATAIQNTTKLIFQDGNFDDYDYSEKYAAIRVALLAGKHVPEKLLIPSHFLGAISQTYKSRKYNEVIELSDRILKKGNLEEYISSQIRHYLCMALARIRNPRFLSEVQMIHGNEHNYVLGFYYRLQGRYDDALARQTECVDDVRWGQNSRREIVLIHNIRENYSDALELARASYRDNPSSAINIQAYFDVLMNIKSIDRNSIGLEHEISATMVAITKLKNNKAQEIMMCMEAKYALHIEHAPKKAIEIADSAIIEFPSNSYPALTKLELALSLKDQTLISNCLDHIKTDHPVIYNTNVLVKKAQVMQKALTGDTGAALNMLDTELGFLHDKAKERLRNRIVGNGR